MKNWTAQLKSERLKAHTACDEKITPKEPFWNDIGASWSNGAVDLTPAAPFDRSAALFDSETQVNQRHTPPRSMRWTYQRIALKVKEQGGKLTPNFLRVHLAETPERRKHAKLRIISPMKTSGDEMLLKSDVYLPCLQLNKSKVES